MTIFIPIFQVRQQEFPSSVALFSTNLERETYLQPFQKPVGIELMQGVRVTVVIITA